MATNGVILINLDNRNAAEFNRILVPDSYEKASGALEAGAFVTVYKWLYQGFMMGPSICNAVAETDHINLVDKTNGGILQVYPDDTIYLNGAVAPNVRITPLTANENGVYDIPSGYDGYGPVTVNVSGGAPVDPYAGVAIRISLRTAGDNDNSLLVEYGSADNSGNFTPNGDTIIITSGDVTYVTLGPKLLPGFMAISFYRGVDSALWLSVYTERIQIWLGSELGWSYIAAGGHPVALNTGVAVNTVWGIWRHPGS